MAEQKKGNNHTSIFERKDRVGNGSLCTGNAACKVSERRFRRISGFSVEIRG